jgi:nucleoside-diphosphate-sugar epimerase
MRVLLTGGTGAVGVAAVARLVTVGHSVRVIGRRASCEVPGAEYAVCDVRDYDGVRAQMRGCDAVVHLAAIPRPALASAAELFAINAAGTFNVFQAAAEEGIRRVVQASSINALGLFYGVVPGMPQYFPIDEEHPTFATDAYSFSKNVVEDIGRYFWRRAGISSVALRLPGVIAASRHDRMAERRAGLRDIVAQLQTLPEDERRRRVDCSVQAYDSVRARGIMEDRVLGDEIWGPASILDPEARTVAPNRCNFWTALDERDSAQAIERGLTADYTGSHVLFINDSANIAGIESETLLSLFYPDVRARKRRLVGCEAVVSIDRARALIGFEPEYSFAERETTNANQA